MNYKLSITSLKRSVISEILPTPLTIIFILGLIIGLKYIGFSVVFSNSFTNYRFIGVIGTTAFLPRSNRRSTKISSSTSTQSLHLSDYSLIHQIIQGLGLGFCTWKSIKNKPVGVRVFPLPHLAYQSLLHRAPNDLYPYRFSQSS